MIKFEINNDNYYSKLGKKAELYTKISNERIRCNACARYCEIPEGKIGLCGIRGVKDNALRLFTYGKVIAGNIDPIEKKPVMHYMPGSSVYSIATTGCNWLCQYCQNHDLSQRRQVQGWSMSPKQVVQTAKKYGVEGIAYTYNEPSIFIEFAKDCGIEAHKNNIFNIFVSNGFLTPDSIKMASKFLDCITVDFKGSGENNFVRRYIGIPSSEPIFESLKEISKNTDIHLEITNLIIPKVGEDLDATKKLCRFIYDELGQNVSLHFLRFHPDYKMLDFPQTPIKTLEKHYLLAKKEDLNFVYIGNVPGHKFEHTYCPECKDIVVQRFGFYITAWNLDDKNRCKICSYKIPIIGNIKNNHNKFKYN